jgi:hypothetical protein
MPNYQGLMQMVGQQQGQRQDQPISQFSQQQIVDSINRIGKQQGASPMAPEQAFLFYIEADPQLRQLIDEEMKNYYIQNLPGTGI